MTGGCNGDVVPFTRASDLADNGSVFLYSFVIALVVMSYRLVVLPPENWVLLRGLQASVMVVFITLALFFASGMYDEKIRYAHR